MAFGADKDRKKMTGKERCARTLAGEKTDRTAVFPLVMGFAAAGSGVTYRAFASDFRALGEAQLKFAEEYKVDAVTTCSDAFRLSADLGGSIFFPEDKPPYLTAPLVKTAEDIKRLKRVDVMKGRTGDRVESTRYLVKNAKDRYVLGWVDMPFAEACSACGVSDFLCMLYDEPETAHMLLAFLTDCVIDFALAQAETGCDMIGCGDAAASLISEAFYREFALPYERRVIEAVHSRGVKVKLHICGNTSKLLGSLQGAGADLYNVDHLVDLSEAKRAYGGSGLAFKGNVDPVDLVLKSPEEIVRSARECAALCAGEKYMLSLGCEIPPNAKPENVRAFCESLNFKSV